MKIKKSLLAGVLAFVMITALCAVPAMAADLDANSNVDVVYYEDGSYLVREVITESALKSRGTQTKTGSCVTTYYNASDVAMWDITLTGTFSYNGSTATALSASYSYNIYSSAWAFKSANAYCQENKAIVDGVFVHAFFIPHDTTVTLTCSPTGVLS